MHDEGKLISSFLFVQLLILNFLLFIGLLERMQAGDFDLDMVDYNSPDPPDIDQMKKDELYAL